jgi:hypothetical protein
MNAIENRDHPGKQAANPSTRRLHPGVYALLIGFVVWLVVSVWSFAEAGLANYLLFIVSGFIFIAVALPLILSRVSPRDRAADADDRLPSFREWASWDFDTWQGRLSGLQAAAQILLPIAAVALGMMAFGIAFHVAEHGGV